MTAPQPTPGQSGSPETSPEVLAELLPGFDSFEFVGQGGMGAVYRARQVSLDRVVAVKLLAAPEAGKLADFAARFETEARAMARLAHPNVVAVHDFGTGGGQPNLVMEFVEGEDLATRLARSGPLPPEEARRIALAVAGALAYAHGEGVIHRDLKPSNILLGRDGRVRLADFGLAKIEERGRRPSLTLSNTSMGSLDYAAPEVIERPATADARADLYSLGVVLYEMLTGAVPRGLFKMPSEKVPGLDPRFDTLVCRAMEEDRGERFPGAPEFRDALSAIGPAEPVPAVERGSFRLALPVSLLALGIAAWAAWNGFNRVRPPDEPSVVGPAPPEAANPVPPDPLTDAELRHFAAWLFSLPLSTEPNHVEHQVPDLLPMGSGRNLRRVADLPPGPFEVSRVRIGPLALDAEARENLARLERMTPLRDLRIYAAESAETLSYLEHLTGLLTLTLQAASSDPPPSLPDDHLAHLARLSRIESLRIEGWSGFTGAGLAHLSNRTKLLSLGLTSCPDLDDTGLGEVARFSRLRILGFSDGGGISDAGIARLARLTSLESLHLDGGAESRLSDTAFAPLASLTRLKILSLSPTFPGTGLARIAGMGQIERLTCVRSGLVRDEHLARLSPLRNLRFLRLEDVDIRGEGFAGCEPFELLTGLYLADCPLSDGGLGQIARTFPALETLDLSRNHRSFSTVALAAALRGMERLERLQLGYEFRDEDLVHVATLAGLTALRLEGSRITVAGLPALRKLPRLDTLELNGLPLTDSAVPVLAEFASLKSLDLTGTKISPEGLSELKRFLPGCVVLP